MVWSDEFLTKNKNILTNNKSYEKSKPRKSKNYDDRIKKLETQIRVLQELDHRGKQIKEPLFQEIIDEIKRERTPGFNLTGKKVNTKPYRIIFDKILNKIRELNE